ncbi:FecR family protein [Filimonas effusa]|uniref:FecR family protein n=1 Tax=Filimonas effusa TaxID=2508721 RepID=A0A4Q1D9G3_9BACT|nr:FecR family protein [Filimonas effusa]RXK85478.1 FecR family protein [Filimonas effusa]
MTPQERAHQLFEKYLAGTCTPGEWDELLALVGTLDENDGEMLTEPLYQVWLKTGKNERHSQVPPFNQEQLYQSIIKSGKEDSNTPVRRIKWWRIAAALIASLLVTAALLYYNYNSHPASHTMADTAPENKIKPGVNQAVLTLSNGRQIILDSTATGTISKQGNITVINLNGQLAYKAETGSTAIETVYNTVTTAKANQYQLVLRDGTRVWLNASSSIRFPTEFTGAIRTVEITGEAYFEVAAMPSQPFHVKTNGVDIEVLGTHFNVNAYADEAAIRTSLLEGAVKITAGNKSNLLAPGQEANVLPSGETAVRTGNVALAVAWVNGYFQFDQAPLPVIMRQVGRWYDLDIKYEGQVPDRVFKGKIQRSLPLSGILNLLRKGDIQIRLEGKTLIIMG